MNKTLTEALKSAFLNENYLIAITYKVEGERELLKHHLEVKNFRNKDIPHFEKQIKKLLKQHKAKSSARDEI